MKVIDFPVASTPLDRASVVDPYLISRHATRGLNARRLKIAGWKDPVLGRKVHTAFHANQKPASLTTYQHKVIGEKEDLDELEEVQMLSGLPRTARDWIALREKAHSSISKPSDAVNSKAVRDSTGMPQKLMTTLDPTFDHSIFAAHDLSDELLKTKVMAEKNITRAEFEAAIAKLLGEAEKPWVDEKYFVLENYLKHTEQSRDEQTDDRETDNTTKEELETVPPKPYALIDLLRNKAIRDGYGVEISKKKRVIQANPSADKHLKVSSTPSRPSPLVQAVENSSDLHDEGGIIITAPAVANVDQKEKGKWELFDGNTESVTLGESAPDKLTIR
jgi:hypothetical protein